MVSELENVREIENKLLKVGLEITEKEQEKERVQKIVNAWSGAAGFCGGLILLAYFGENKLVMVIPAVILGILMFFATKKSFEVSRLIRAIDLAKKKKKQLENKLDNLNYLAKVRAKKDKTN